MQNWSNEEFDLDDVCEEATLLTRVEPDAHQDIPAEFPGVELKRELVTSALYTIDSDTDPMLTAGKSHRECRV